MNGMIVPSVSAGSSHRAARDTCTPHVMTPSGAAWSGRAGARRRHASATSAARLREGKSVEPSRGLANDLPPLFVRDPFEVTLDHLARTRPGRHRVGIVGGPHDVLDPMNSRLATPTRSSMKVAKIWRLKYAGEDQHSHALGEMGRRHPFQHQVGTRLLPGRSSTTRGARSRNCLSMRSTQRSPGSFTCESAEISRGSVMIHLQISDAGTGGLRAGTHANGLQSTGPVHRLESVAELTCMVWIGQHCGRRRALTRDARLERETRCPSRQVFLVAHPVVEFV